jgi:NADPH:quinone reductase-like Zn-dependent oxidoreductase
MKLRYKILNTVLALVSISVVGLLLALRYESPCATAPALPAGKPSMKAAVHRCYGPPDVIRLEDLPRPEPAANEILVKIHAASVNPLDWHMLRGEPYVMRLGGGFGSPEDIRLGVDYAGVVEAIGKDVTRFRPGDQVFGGTGRGSLAEYVSVIAEGTVMPKPANVTFEQAAAVPVAAITALQAVRDEGGVRPGKKVLINGASGGVGTFAVQIAKSLGAEVTGVCSTRNLDMVRSIGADHVIDYTKEDFTRGERRYDVIIDNVSSGSMLDYERALEPDGIVVIVGSTDKGRWLGALKSPLKALALSPFVTPESRKFFSRLSRKDLAVLADLMRDGKLNPVIDRRYRAEETPDAIRYVEGGHARGKVVVSFQTRGGQE